MTLGRLSATNYRGVRLPVVLGFVVAGGAAIGCVAIASRDAGLRWGVLAGSLLVFAAGLVDDLSPPGPRGWRGHLAALVSFRVTTGTVKLLVTVGAAVVVVALLPSTAWWVEVARVVSLAGSANVANGLDVRPGRAIKAYLPVAVVVLLVGFSVASYPTVPGVTVAAVIALPFDLRERAMLGDGGSNLLGFTAGLGLIAVLPSVGVVIAALLTVALNALAETVTLSRLIDRAPPLAWYDRLGRLTPWA